MKKITGIAIITLMLCFLSNKIIAQTDYTYTLIDNGNYSFSIALVPSTTTSDFETNVQSYGFTIFLPDGIGYTSSYSLGGSATGTPFNGDQVGGSASEDGFLITETLPGPIDIAAPNDAANNPVVVFTLTVTGNPTSGELRIMANNDPESTAFGGALVSFLQADTIDNGTFEYSNRINSTTGLSGISTFSFATLTTENVIFNNISIYPNPVKNVLNIKGLGNELIKASIYNITGQKVISQTTGLKTINTSSLAPGVYFLNLETNDASKTIKIVKK